MPGSCDGSYATVAPFLRDFAGIDVRPSVEWLIIHGELPPDLSDRYDPRADAQAHLEQHAGQPPCLACGVWAMLDFLWAMTEELYEGREVIAMSAALSTVAHDLDVLCTTANNAGTTEGARAAQELRAVLEPDAMAESLDRARHRLLSGFSREAQAIIDARRATPMVTRACELLRNAGFSLAETAMLIGDQQEGAAERVRKRLQRLR